MVECGPGENEVVGIPSEDVAGAGSGCNLAVDLRKREREAAAFRVDGDTVWSSPAGTVKCLKMPGAPPRGWGSKALPPAVFSKPPPRSGAVRWMTAGVVAHHRVVAAEAVAVADEQHVDRRDGRRPLRRPSPAGPRRALGPRPTAPPSDRYALVLRLAFPPAAAFGGSACAP